MSRLRQITAGSDPDYDRVTRLARATVEVPFAVIHVLESSDEAALTGDTTPDPDGFATSFCAEALAHFEQRYLLVPDAHQDLRFAQDPLVTGSRQVRFYLGVPILLKGRPAGILSLLSHSLHAPPPEEAQIGALIELADLAGSLFDLKQQAHTGVVRAAALTREQWQHALVLNAGGIGSWLWDVPSGNVEANATLRQLFGLPDPGGVDISDIVAAIAPADVPNVQAALQALFQNTDEFRAEFRVKAGLRWLTGRGRVLERDGQGKPLMVIGVNSDITEAKQSAENTRLLLRELNHRVKNTLAMIQSLARQTLRRASDPSQFIESFGGRLRAVSDAHTLLSDKDWTGVRLWDLVQKQVAPYAQARPDQLVASGPDIDLPADHALGLALVLHELATNAARVGALSIPEGQVNIAWEVRSVGETRLLMRWKETGGPEVSPPEVTGFGSILIARSLDKVLTSEVNLVYPRDGVEATISIPLPGPERP